MDRKKRYAVVTGASKGIGRAIAVALGKIGATVELVARSKPGLEETKRLVAQAGGDTNVFPLDLRDTQAIYTLAESLKKSWGHVDILVNTAGIYHDERKAHYNIPFTNYSPEEIRNTYEVGTNGTTFMSHAILPLMTKGGHIINISGTFENGNSGWLPYYVSKRAVEDFTVGLAQELTDQGIAVNCISPSDVATESYKKFFPQYFDEALDPRIVGKFAVKLSSTTAPPQWKNICSKKRKTAI